MEKHWTYAETQGTRRGHAAAGRKPTSGDIDMHCMRPEPGDIATGHDATPAHGQALSAFPAVDFIRRLLGTRIPPSTLERHAEKII